MDPYKGTFEPITGYGPTISPDGGKVLGGWTPSTSGGGSGGSGSGGSSGGSSGPNVAPGSSNSTSAAVNGLIVFFVLLAVGVIGVAIAFGVVMVLKKQKVNALNRN